MRRRFKIAFVILLIATVVWALACYLHVQAYNQMIEGYRQRLGDEIVDRLMDFKPVLMWGHGDVLLLIGFFMFFAWVGFCVELRREMRK